MRPCGGTISNYLSPENREGLEAIIADRNSKAKAVWRARIVLATAEAAMPKR